MSAAQIAIWGIFGLDILILIAWLDYRRETRRIEEWWSAQRSKQSDPKVDRHRPLRR